MLKIENYILPSPAQWKAIIMGARNPLNSWDRFDSVWEQGFDDKDGEGPKDWIEWDMEWDLYYVLGPNDLSLLKKLAKAGTDHRKFMRMLNVYVDITAPLYWFKEFDTYKVGTVANSCSTMHKIQDKEFTLENFSCEHLSVVSKKCLEMTIETINEYRTFYNMYDTFKNGDVPVSNEIKELLDKYSKKDIWWQMIQLLPSSYNQKRTVMLNYETLANMYHSRKNHKLDEWRDFCEWIREELPYSVLITGEEKE